ncbi:MAG: DNA replication and repair protein RecF [Thermoleophilia bacterium]
MYLKSLNVSSFRNYREGFVEFPPGITIIVGDNGAGKSNLLEAAQYNLCGASFRTSRDVEMVAEGSSFFRTEAEVENGAVCVRAVSLERGGSARVDSGGGPKWIEPGSVLCFSPDDLQLIKGPPSDRRRFLDDTISKRNPSHRRRVVDYQKTLSQRNSFLQRARAGLVPLPDISPWDRQLASLALSIFEARRLQCEELSPHFERALNEIADEDTRARINLVSQIQEAATAADPEAVLVDKYRENWSSDMERLSTGTGTHRDDVDFILDDRSLKPFGSQGEQRAAVLALMLAERNLSWGAGDRRPLLLLDDVMSELDPDRRRRLMGALGVNGESPESAGGQVIITAADTDLFTPGELERSKVIRVSEGSFGAPGDGGDG